ncbi:MAG: DUF371 domain-containing protein [Methanobacteriota archaeon]
MVWVVRAKGHPMVTARHRTTFMITKDGEVGPRGDCIIGVRAERSSIELDSDLKKLVASGAPLLITLRAGKLVEKIRARGHPSINLNHLTDIVIRKSKFICGRTLAVGADKAAEDLSREFVHALRNPATDLEMEIVAEPLRI